MKDALVVVSFLIYSILFECLIWGGGAFLIVKYDWSAWLLLLMAYMSSKQIKPGPWRKLITGEVPERSVDYSLRNF